MEGTNPVNKKLLAALSGGAALALALSGCSDDSEVDDYAKKVCDQLKPQLQKITDANESITSTAADGNPADIKKADSAAFQQISSAYAAMAVAVDNEGAPPVDDGEQKQRSAVQGLNATSKAYAQLKTDVDRLNTGDQAKFAAGLQDIAQKLDTVNKTGDDAIENLQSGEVGEAMSKQSGCKRPSGASPESS